MQRTANRKKLEPSFIDNLSKTANTLADFITLNPENLHTIAANIKASTRKSFQTIAPQTAIPAPPTAPSLPASEPVQASTSWFGYIFGAKATVTPTLAPPPPPPPAAKTESMTAGLLEKMDVNPLNTFISKLHESKKFKNEQLTKFNKKDTSHIYPYLEAVVDFISIDSKESQLLFAEIIKQAEVITEFDKETYKLDAPELAPNINRLNRLFIHKLIDVIENCKVNLARAEKALVPVPLGEKRKLTYVEEEAAKKIMKTHYRELMKNDLGLAISTQRSKLTKFAEAPIKPIEEVKVPSVINDELPGTPQLVAKFFAESLEDETTMVRKLKR